MKCLAFIAVAALALPGPAKAAAEADTTTGNGLLAVCSGEGVFEISLCVGYIVGASDMAGTLGVYCSPGGVTNGQFRDVAVNGLRNDPANRQKYSSVLIAKYLRAAFPCGK
jgi:hypothetical protein